MEQKMRNLMIISVLLTGTLALNAQKVTNYATTEKAPWVTGKTALAAKAEGTVVVTVDMVLPMVVVTEIMEAMVVMAPQEDKPHNTYFIDNPLIIGGETDVNPSHLFLY